jgi:peptidoglycan hydrolase-like amidase
MWIPIAATVLLAMPMGCAVNAQEAATPAWAFEKEPDIRVRLVHTLDEIMATPRAPYTIYDTQGEWAGLLEPDQELRVAAIDGNVLIEMAESGEIARAPFLRIASAAPQSSVLLKGVPYGVGWWWESREDRAYEGALEFRVGPEGKLDIVLVLPVEEYLRGVVPQEIGPDSPLEALKAQAVAARSETFDALISRKYAGAHYDICSDVDCQAFSGTARRSAATDRAIAETRGMAMFVDGKPIAAYYASNCGGHSENIENVWPERSGPVHHWSGNLDGHGTAPDLTVEANVRAWIENPPAVECSPIANPDLPGWTHRNFRWERRFTAEEATARVATVADIGRVVEVRPIRRGVSGRLIEATFVGENGSTTVKGELNIRRVFDPPLRSSTFVVDTEGGSQEAPETFVFRGAGWGHGVGMCQTGAIGRAQKGQTYDSILAHYYRGVAIRSGYPPAASETP